MKKKVLLTSILTIALCLSLIAGSTFALFTSESSVNIAVTAGKVNVDAEIGELTLYSMGVKQTGNFENGGTAAYDATNNKLTLTNITPGDKVEFPITVKNNSNVAIAYRLTWDIADVENMKSLKGALVATADGTVIANSQTAWSTDLAADATKEIKVAVELPVDAGNDYQEAAASITFKVEAVQANGTDLYGKTVVSSVEGLVAAAADPATEIIALAEPLTITGDVTVDLDGKDIEGSLVLEEGAKLELSNGDLINDDENVSAIQINGKNTTVVLDNVNIESARHALRIEGDNANVTINGGVYKAAPTSNKTLHALNVGEDGITCNVVINGGTFIGPKGTIADSGSAVNVKAGSTVTINGGNFSGGKNKTLSSNGTLIVKGGTFDQNPSAYLATGYKAVASNGSYIVVPESTNVAGSAADISSAINGGNKDVLLTDDVTYNTAINKDANINLNGNTFEATNTIELKGNADLTMTGGNYEVNSTYGHIDVRPSTAEGSALTFEDVDFSFNKLGPTYGPSTNRLGSVVEVCATVTDAHTKIIFENCTFNNAQVLFEGMSGKTGTFEAEFINCTFNALTSSAPIYVQNYVNGTIKVTGCTFNLECTSSTASAISVSPSTSTAVTVIADNNTLNATVATPTDSSVTGVDVVKVNGTPKDIKLISIGGTTSTATITNTTVSGIAIN